MRFYAVTRGRQVGLYDSVDDAQDQVFQYSGGFFKGFYSYQEAKRFLIDRVNCDWWDSTTGQWDSDGYIEVFTDGACLGNGRPDARAGYAVYFPSRGDVISGPLSSNYRHTNNRAEYFAVLTALTEADEMDPRRNKTLRIYTDSQLLITSLVTYLPKWIRTGWITLAGEPVKNQDLLQDIDELMHNRRVEFFHVRAHSDDDTYEARGNAIADKYAKQAAEEAQVRYYY
jgi:ribonuclease HI